MNTSQTQTKKGFTLVETLVAIFILTTAIAAALTAAGAGLQSSFYARDQITAYYLAEEAVEYIRNIRDTNFSNKSPNWLSGIPSGCFSANSLCRVDVPQNIIDIAPDEASLQLHFNPDLTTSGGGYTYDTIDGPTTSTRYTRHISIQYVDSDDHTNDEIFITVTVTWGSSLFSSRSFTLKEELYNWKDVSN